MKAPEKNLRYWKERYFAISDHNQELRRQVEELKEKLRNSERERKRISQCNDQISLDEEISSLIHNAGLNG